MKRIAFVLIMFFFISTVLAQQEALPDLKLEIMVPEFKSKYPPHEAGKLGCNFNNCFLLVPGDEVILRFKITNKGQASSGKIKLEATITNGGVVNTLEETLPSIDPGKFITHS